MRSFLKGKVLEMDKRYKVGVVVAGMARPVIVTLLENHPWFKLTTLAAFRPGAGQDL